MQDNSYIQKIVSGESFEELEKILQGRTIELKEAYKIRDDKYASWLRRSIEGLIKQSKEKAEISYQQERLKKRIKRYKILINVGKIISEPEVDVEVKQRLDQLLEGIPDKGNKLKEEILEPSETGNHKYPPVTKAFKDSADIKLKQKTYPEHFSDYKRFEDLLGTTIRRLEGTFMRKDLYDQLKLLRKNFYKKRNLDEEGIIELRSVIEKAKKSCMGFEDIESSLDLFLKDVLDH